MQAKISLVLFTPKNPWGYYLKIQFNLSDFKFSRSLKINAKVSKFIIIANSLGRNSLRIKNEMRKYI